MILDQTVSPTYQTNQPNGPGCGPTCHQAGADWTIPSLGRRPDYPNLGPDLAARLVEVPKFPATVADSMVAWPLSKAVPLIGAEHHDLADVDLVGRQLLRQEADQLVLGGVDDGEAHGVPLDADGVDLGSA